MNLGFILVVFGCVGTAVIIPMSLITGKYFDQLLQEKNLPKPNSIGILPFDIMNRTNRYVGYIIWNGPKKRRWDTYRQQIGDFSFRRYARGIDYFFIVIQAAGAFSLIFAAILGMLK
jgi:hypothetical protein